MNPHDQAQIRDRMDESRQANLEICRIVARVLQPYIPPGWTGKVQFVVDNGRLTAHDVSVELRIPRTRKM